MKLSLNPNYRSPFGVNAEKVGKYHKGGKHDDTTAVVSQIKHHYDCQEE